MNIKTLHSSGWWTDGKLDIEFTRLNISAETLSVDASAAKLFKTDFKQIIKD